MKKLAIAAGLVALVLAAPALAGDRGGSSSQGRSNPTFGSPALKQMSNALRLAMLTHSGFWSGDGDFDWSHGRHFGWSNGRHWGWFKPHNPHWPHEPPASP